MAQQTINVGAAPNDGTGTPLRTAFQYTNSNFTELYTALGGGVGLPGATTQVIFNDGGTNLAGDAGLVYNKTTDALTIGGNVQAASATITGALGAAGLNVTGATIPANGVYLGSANNLSFSAASTLGMTLNSTGLGVGAVPSVAKLELQSATDTLSLINSTNTAQGNRAALFMAARNVNGNVGNVSIEAISVNNQQNDLVFRTGSTTINGFGTERMRIDTTGNVGISVTPSAWSAYKALQIGRGSFSSDTSSATAVSTLFGSNFVYDGNWKYIVAAAATFYQQTGGVHYWFNEAGTKAAGATFTPVQAMTLDASGNLLVGTVTAPAGTKVGAIAKLSGVSVEGTAAISVSTTPVAIAKSLGTGGLFFVTGYNTSGGTQCWFLVASKQDSTPTVIASENSTGLTVTFTNDLGVIKMNTNSGTIQVNSFAVTN